MKKYLVIYSVVLLILFALFPVGIKLVPPPWAADYLLSIPHVEIVGIILIKPSSTIIVYGLGILTIVLGILLYRKQGNKLANLWGLSLIIWGVGTMLAGSSYQAFGYELKCAGRNVCLFTSWFELSYLYVTALSILIMGYVISERLKQPIKSKYQLGLLLGFGFYSLTLLLGVLIEAQFLVSYEYFLIIFVLFFGSFFYINVRSYLTNNNDYDKHLIQTWLILLLVNVLYFIYLLSGAGDQLYDSYNIWFSANDVLHVGLVLWMLYFYRSVSQFSTGNEL